MIRWQVFDDCANSAALGEGLLPVDQLQSAGDGSLRLGGFSYLPVVAQHAQELVVRASQSNDSTAIAEFQVPTANMTIIPANNDAIAREYSLLRVRLELQPAQDETGDDAGDWFRWKIERAAEYRSRGNDAFKQQRLRAARRLYSKAVAWLACPADCEFASAEREELKPLLAACHMNLATCYWKLGDMEQCIAQCSSALQADADHVKARYRRGQAFLATKEFDKGLADLAAALEIEPTNKLFASSVERARVSKQQFVRKQQAAFTKLFPTS